jgi:hypothetical protein
MSINLQQLFLDGIDTLATFVANCFTKALLPVDFLAVCFVLAIMKVLYF